MAIKSWALALVACALLALATPSSASRNLLATCGDDCGHMNKVLASAYLKANYFHCAAYGRPIDAAYCGGGPAPTGCAKAALSDRALIHAQTMAQAAIQEIIRLRAVLGVYAIAQPAIDIQVKIRLILNAIVKIDLGSLFNCYADDKQFFLGAFIITNLDLNIKLAVRYLVKLRVYIDLLVQLIPTCQNYVSLIRAELLVWANVILFSTKCPYSIKVIVQLCIEYLDCGLASVLGVKLDVILAPLLNLLLSINLSALLSVLVKLVAILKVCVSL